MAIYLVFFLHWDYLNLSSAFEAAQDKMLLVFTTNNVTFSVLGCNKVKVFGRSSPLIRNQYSTRGFLWHFCIMIIYDLIWVNGRESNYSEDIVELYVSQICWKDVAINKTSLI